MEFVRTLYTQPAQCKIITKTGVLRPRTWSEKSRCVTRKSAKCWSSWRRGGIVIHSSIPFQTRSTLRPPSLPSSRRRPRDATTAEINFEMPPRLACPAACAAASRSSLFSSLPPSSHSDSFFCHSPSLSFSLFLSPSLLFSAAMKESLPPMLSPPLSPLLF